MKKYLWVTFILAIGVWLIAWGAIDMFPYVREGKPIDMGIISPIALLIVGFLDMLIVSRSVIKK
jgi:hypothetical protein